MLYMFRLKSTWGLQGALQHSMHNIRLMCMVNINLNHKICLLGGCPTKQSGSDPVRYQYASAVCSTLVTHFL